MKKVFIINSNDANRRLDKFLQKAVPDFPPSLMYKLFRKKDIKINGRRAEASQMLCEGDEVTVYIKEDFSDKAEFIRCDTSDLDIVYEDENIVVIDKRAGQLCQSDGKNTGGTLSEMLKSYLYDNGEFDPEKENSFSPALCNRLDRNTRGLVIGAKNAAALRTMNEKIRLREVHKFYLCRAQGTPPKDADTVTSFINKDEKQNKSSLSDSGKEIVTSYRIVSKGGGVSTLEIELHTGRSHQIRAQMADLGCPLVGDVKYGAKTGGGQQLLAYKIIFDFKSPSALDYLNHKEIVSKQKL